MSLFTEHLAELKQEKELYFELGLALTKQRKYRKAIDFLLEAKRTEGQKPAEWLLLYYLGQAYRHLDHGRDALSYLIESAIRAGDQKQQVFQEIKAMINTSNAHDVQDLLQEALREPGLTDADKSNISDLQKFAHSMFDGADEDIRERMLADAQQNVDECEQLLRNNKYKDALAKVEMGLTKDPLNHSLLFMKMRLLIEGQTDFHAARILLNDPEFGYRREYDDSQIIEQVKKVIEAEPDRGNAWFFAAFVAHQLKYDPDTVNYWLDKATALKLENEKTYPETGLLLLRAEVEERKDQKQKAAQYFFEAARNYYWQTNYTEAEALFKKATVLDPAATEAAKYYADTLFMRSYLAEPPYMDAALLQTAYQAWHTGNDVVTEKKNSWYYIVIARIHEARFKFVQRKFYDEYWKSALYGERAIVHSPDDYSTWTYLGTFYRNLNAEVNCLQCYNKAQSINSEFSFLTEEKIIVQLNTAQWDEPRNYLERLRTDDPTRYSRYHKSWDAYILYHADKYVEAAALMDEVVKEEPTNLFAHQIKMFCYWQLRDFSQAQAVAGEILALFDKYDFRKEEFIIGWAHFIMGNVTTAISILENYNTASGVKWDQNFSLAPFYLFAGQLDKARDYFERFIRFTFNLRSLYEFKRFLVSIAEIIEKREAVPAGTRNEVLATASHWLGRVDAQMRHAETNPLSPQLELQQMKVELEFADSSLQGITTQAAIARLLLESGDRAAAYRAYQRIESLDIEKWFPEAAVAINNIEEALFADAAAFINASMFAEVIAQFDTFGDVPLRSEWRKHIFLGIAHYALGDAPKAHTHLGIAFDSTATDTNLRQRLWDTVMNDVYSERGTWGLGNFIIGGNYHGQVALEKEMVTRFWEVLANKQNLANPDVTPVVIEVDNDIVPAEASSDDWYVIRQLIPAQRERIQQRFGVTTGAVRIRANATDLRPGEYVILMEDIPVARGRVEKDKIFVVQEGEPITGNDPGWVEQTKRQELIDSKATFIEDPFVYMLSHLETFLSRYPNFFVDIQFTEDYLTGYPATPAFSHLSTDVAEKARKIDGSSAALLLFNQTLKALTAEQVSIANKETVIAAFVDAIEREKEISGLTAALRVALKAELPFNKMTLQKFELPADLETRISAAVSTTGGKSFLAMKPDECQQLLQDIKPHIDTMNIDKQLLVVNTPGLRWFVRKLFDMDYPSLTIAGKNELVDQ
jgi:tetratricopeptide (TPR) repeat protein